MTRVLRVDIANQYYHVINRASTRLTISFRQKKIYCIKAISI